MRLNKIGEKFGALDYVEAMTDVTGFGLLGHLAEMCEASNTSAMVHFDAAPTLDRKMLDYYLDLNCVPGGTVRNWNSYGHKIAGVSEYQRNILADPQTSGGLLVAIRAERSAEFEAFATQEGLELGALGFMSDRQGPLITVI